MAGILSLTGALTYPIELLKTLTVDDKSTFKSAVVIGDAIVSSGAIALALGDSQTESLGNYSIASGINSKALGDCSLSVGKYIDSNNICAITLGRCSEVKHDYAFAWSGVESVTKYESKGEGTFCVNPKNDIAPEYSFYIGDKHIPQLISEYAGGILNSDNLFKGGNTFSKTLTALNGIVVSDGTFSTSTNTNTVFSGNVTVPNQSASANNSYAANTKFVKDNLANYVPKTGATLTGKLVLDGDPTSELHAVTKNYVDKNHTDVKVSNAGCRYGHNIGSVTVNDSTVSFYTPEIIAGSNVDILKNESNGTITISFNSDVSPVGGSVHVPVGTILPIASDNAPEGFMLCDGSALPRSEFAELFAVIGTKFGIGNGSTTFNIPKLNDGIFLEGSNSNGQSKNAGLPGISVSSTLSPIRANSTLSLPSAHSSISAQSISIEFDESTVNISGNTNTNKHYHDILFSAKDSTSGYPRHGGTHSGCGHSGKTEESSHSHTFTGTATFTPKVKRASVTGGSVNTYLTGGGVTTTISGGSISSTLEMDTTIYGKSYTVQPKSVSVRYYIKYKETDSDKCICKINGKSPETAGNITIEATDVKALPSTGGEMTGNLIFTKGSVIRQNNVSDSLKIQSGYQSSADAGASITLNGFTTSNNQGGFGLTAKDAYSETTLVGSANGTIKWNGENIVRKVNGVSANTSGEVSINTEEWTFTLSDGTTVTKTIFAETKQ